MIRITVAIDVRRELESDFAMLAESHAAASQQESGCHSFRVYNDGDCRYLFVEEYRDYYAVLEHRRSDHYRRWRAEINHFEESPRNHVETCDTPAQKVIDEVTLCELLKGREFLFTNGCFDLLHPGHLHVLEFASSHGPLAVGVNTDLSMERIKRKPVLTCADRCLMLAAMACVSFVVPFAEDTPLGLIRRLSPRCVVKGPEYAGRESECSDSCPVIIAPPCTFTRHSSDLSR